MHNNAKVGHNWTITVPLGEQKNWKISLLNSQQEQQEPPQPCSGSPPAQGHLPKGLLHPQLWAGLGQITQLRLRTRDGGMSSETGNQTKNLSPPTMVLAPLSVSEHPRGTIACTIHHRDTEVTAGKRLHTQHLL